MDTGGIVVGSSVLGGFSFCLSNSIAPRTFDIQSASFSVNNKHRATVRYIGVTNFAEGVWYGLELERDIGEWASVFVEKGCVGVG